MCTNLHISKGSVSRSFQKPLGVSLKFHLGQGPSCHPPRGGTAEGTALPGILVVLFRENPVVPQLTCLGSAGPPGHMQQQLVAFTATA